MDSFHFLSLSVFSNLKIYLVIQNFLDSQVIFMSQNRQILCDQTDINLSQQFCSQALHGIHFIVICRPFCTTTKMLPGTIIRIALLFIGQLEILYLIQKVNRVLNSNFTVCFVSQK